MKVSSNDDLTEFRTMFHILTSHSPNMSLHKFGNHVCKPKHSRESTCKRSVEELKVSMVSLVTLSLFTKYIWFITSRILPGALIQTEYFKSKNKINIFAFPSLEEIKHIRTCVSGLFK